MVEAQAMFIDLMAQFGCYFFHALHNGLDFQLLGTANGLEHKRQAERDGGRDRPECSRAGQ